MEKIYQIQPTINLKPQVTDNIASARSSYYLMRPVQVFLFFILFFYVFNFGFCPIKMSSEALAESCAHGNFSCIPEP